MALPKYFVLKSNKNNKYLEYLKEDVEVHGLNKFSAENPVSPYAKYEIETAKTGHGLVHIKCCYNNKYLVRWSADHWWIAAAADEPEEDKSKWSCTLFEFHPMDGAKTIRFRHVELGHYVGKWWVDNILYADCLFGGLPDVDEEHCDIFTIIDWESLCILPRHVGFKGENGCYLSLRQVNGKPHLQFESTESDPAAINEVLTAHDGSVRITSSQNNKFWRRTSTLDWICADSYDSTSVNPDTLFLPVRVDSKAIALKNLGNNLFCKRFTTRDTTSCLSANSNTICREERLEVKELVTSRYIYNVNYHLKDARIYHQRVLLLASGTVVNRSEEPNTLDLKLAYVDSKSKDWNASVASKKGVKTDIQASFPVINIADGKKVEILDGSNGVFIKWGEAIKSSKISEVVYKVTVPAMTQVKVSLHATKGSCDVPFSYNQLDTLTDGRIVGHTMDDGIYTGFNYYNFKYETEEEKLAEI